MSSLVGTILVVAGGTRPETTAVHSFLNSLPPVRHVVGVDFGIDHALSLGMKVDSAVGDMDSVTAAGRAWAERCQATVEEYPAEKDETDLEIGIDRAITVARSGSDGQRLTLGFLALSGDRSDHVLANLQVVSGPRTKDFCVRALLADSVLSVAGGDRAESSVEIKGRPDSRVSIHPMGGSVDHISTSGLRYPLDGERLETGEARGVSNALEGPRATITVTAGTAVILQELVHDRRDDDVGTLSGGELDAIG